VAANLAVHARALRGDLAVLLLALGERPLVDAAFALGGEAPHPTAMEALREGRLEGAVRPGRHGVRWVPSPRAAGGLADVLASPAALHAALEGTVEDGLVVVDFPEAPEGAAHGALGACDLVAVVVSERASLARAEGAAARLREAGRGRERVRVVLSLDGPLRAPERGPDELALVLGELRRRRWLHVAALLSDPPAPARPGEEPPLLHASCAGRAGRQMRAVAEELLEALAEVGDEPATAATRGRDAAESSAWSGGSPRAFHRFLLRESTAQGGG
jgi:hypothetical protein